MESTKAYDWHSKYSVMTEVFGKFGQKICAKKSCGIGDAKRHWKANKRQLQGQRARLGPENTKQQAAIAASYSSLKTATRRAGAAKAGMLWDEGL